MEVVVVVANFSVVWAEGRLVEQCHVILGYLLA